MVFKSEKEFQIAYLKGLTKKWAFVRNIPDIWNTKKPFDAFWCIKWKGLALEFKIDKAASDSTEERILKKLYPHQVANLLEFQKAGWVSMVISYHMVTDTIFNYSINLKWELSLSKKQARQEWLKE